ncbi:TPA: hypothetical protein KPF84_001414 [Clostridioides difficile]|nr:hypothetical protein [Clostridioides difficile]MBY2485307.1 hypothetical protein [Clostridioides difficile]HBE9481637.1 hypothetical protein [Clostridioides difficile]HBG0962189.1 hypothetical protein [Clostridioides difficile]
MEKFVFRGGFNMNTYEIMFRNKSNLDLEQSCYVDNLYDLFAEKIKYVTKTLKNNNIEDEEWDINFIKEEALESVKNIKNEFIIDKALDWRVNLSIIIKELLEKNKTNFRIADEMYDDSMKRSEQYYDLLSNIFDNAEELINIKYRNYKNSKSTNVNQLVNNDNSSNYVDNEHISIKFEFDLITDDDYALAA